MEKQLKKVGLITYHSAYNFGSILQAYATQEIIAKLGHDVEIINYRLLSQKRFYGIICYKNGIKKFIYTLLQCSKLFKRIARKNNYENFIKTRFNLTNEINNPEELDSLRDKYDIYISGSDQIWNKHSNELYNVDWKYMNPYLLSFTKKKKISYASSIANMSDDELRHIKNELLRFSSISCREFVSSKRIEEICNKKVENVLDPTLLLDKSEWEERICTKRIISGEYVLLYYLGGPKSITKEIYALKKIEKKIVLLSPLCPVPYVHGVINYASAGPIEFLNLIKYSKYVVTNSYHGLLISINFNKNFYYLRSSNENSNIRQDNILIELGLINRNIYSCSDIHYHCIVDYNEINEKLSCLRKKSIEYLRKMI